MSPGSVKRLKSSIVSVIKRKADPCKEKLIYVPTPFTLHMVGSFHSDYFLLYHYTSSERCVPLSEIEIGLAHGHPRTSGKQ